MIINIEHDSDLITLDFRVKQIRYLKDYKNRGEILFLNQNLEGYEYLFNEDLNLFYKSLKEDLFNWGIKTQIKQMRVLK